MTAASPDSRSLRRAAPRTLAALLLITLASAAPATAAGFALARPARAPLTASDRAYLVQWALADPQVQTRIAGARTRVLAAEVEMVKEAGGERERGSVYVRNYRSGLTHWLHIDLETGAVTAEDLAGMLQPSQEELAEARALIAADPALAAANADARLKLQGGFLKRALVPEDPCAHEVCLLYYFMRAGFPRGADRAVVVNLSRGRVVNHDLDAASGQLGRLTAEGGR